MPEVITIPNNTEIRRDLEFMTARWDELTEPAVFEIRAFKEGSHPQTARFAADWMDDAVDWVISLNSLGFNIYAVRNPIRHDVVGSASDDDIIAAFFLWADCDDSTAAGNVFRFDGPKWSAAVVTGQTPSVRVHTYWALKTVCTDMAEWRAMQESIAAHFRSDSTVVNPSRIMRVGGTVSYPAKHKQKRGYIKEVTTIRTEYDDARAPVTMDQMRRVFGESAPLAITPATGITIAAGDKFQPLDRERAAIKALSGVEWNNEVFKLVGSYVRKGNSDSEIHTLTAPLTLAGYTEQDTWAEVQKMIDRTRTSPKFEGAGGDDETAPTQPNVIVENLNILTSSEFVADLTPPVYIVDGVLAERRCHSMSGFAGHGKTTLGLHLAICVATGGNFGGNECAQGSVLILAGENPDNVKWQYASAIAAAGKTSDLPIFFLPGHLQLSVNLPSLLKEAGKIENLKLIIIDSLQAFFEGENDNANVEMVDAARRFRLLTELPSKPSCVVIAHPAGKRPDKENIVPRGGSGFGNEMDGNFTVWAEPDGTQVFHHSEKHRGAPFEPLNFIMEEREFDHIRDHKGRPLRLKISRQQMAVERMASARKSETRDEIAIQFIEQNPKMTATALASHLNVSSSTADRIMHGLKAEKLIKRRSKKWVLTEDGKDFFNEI